MTSDCSWMLCQVLLLLWLGTFVLVMSIVFSAAVRGDYWKSFCWHNAAY
jgi:hypothetical protein